MAGVDSIIRVTSSVLSGGVVTARPFGAGLIITTDDTLTAGGADKIKSFATASAASGFFPATSDVLAAVKQWHAQNPAPQPLYVVRWADADVDTVFTGGTSTIDPSAVLAANYSLVIGDTAVTGINLSSAGTAAAVATALQTKLRADGPAEFNACTVTGTGGVYTVTLDDGAEIPAFFTDHTAGTALAVLLGWDEDSGPVLRVGSDQESVAVCLAAAERLQPNEFYFVARDSDTPDDLSSVDTDAAIAEYAGDNGLYFFMSSVGAATLTAAETTSYGAQVSALESARTVGTWERTAGTKHISAAATLSAVDLDQPDSLITLKFQTLTGETADSLLPEEIAELDRKRLNRYSRVGGVPIYSEGFTFDPDIWADVRFWLDWLTASLETKLFDLLVSNGRIPLTQFGLALIKDTMTRVLEQGVKNGGIAPGTVSAAMKREIQLTTGNAGFDGNLTNGYLVWCKPLSTLSQADRDARIAPKASIWLKGSSAIHSLNIALTFEN